MSTRRLLHGCFLLSTLALFPYATAAGNPPPAPPPAPQVLRGRVVVRAVFLDSGEPFSDGAAAIRELKAGGNLAPDGTKAFDVPPGSYTVIIQAMGVRVRPQRADVRGGETVTVEFRVPGPPSLVDPVPPRGDVMVQIRNDSRVHFDRVLVSFPGGIRSLGSVASGEASGAFHAGSAYADVSMEIDAGTEIRWVLAPAGAAVRYLDPGSYIYHVDWRKGQDQPSVRVELRMPGPDPSELIRR